MVTLNSLKDFKPLSGSVLTVGTFDGIHLGHQKVFKLVKSRAEFLNTKSVVITFQPHPQHILRKANQPAKKLLCSYEDKLALLEKMGIDYLIILPFDTKMNHTTAEEFLEKIIIDKFRPNEIVLGHDHHFGHQRRGDAEFLRSVSGNYGFKVEEVEPFLLLDEIVSSTSIRNYLSQSNIKSTAKMLGRQYAINGTVVKGSGRGKALSFPTANINPENEHLLIPGNGVYLVDVFWKENHFHGMCNIGVRPTFDDSGNKKIEVHLFDDNIPDLYGEKLRIEFINFIRNEDKFPSATELVSQIRKDREQCIELIEETEN